MAHTISNNGSGVVVDTFYGRVYVAIDEDLSDPASPISEINLTPSQAREVADALKLYADRAERGS